MTNELIKWGIAYGLTGLIMEVWLKLDLVIWIMGITLLCFGLFEELIKKQEKLKVTK